MRTYSEINYQKYISPYEIPDIEYPQNASFTLTTPEFAHDVSTNSLGIRDRDYDKKRKKEYRVLILGDSFTFGVGVPIESTWIDLIRKKINKLNIKNHITIINGGILGADIISQYRLFSDKLAIYDPDLVVYMLNTSDISDIACKGGLERYKQKAKHPIYESLWKWSHLYRFIMKFFLKWNDNLMNPAESTAREKLSIKTIIDTAELFSKQMALQNKHFILFLHPYPYEVDSGFFNENLQSALATNKFDYIDTTNNFIEALSGLPLSQYSYLLDGHYNKQGNIIFSEIFYKLFAPIIIRMNDSLEQVPRYQVPHKTGQPSKS